MSNPQTPKEMRSTVMSASITPSIMENHLLSLMLFISSSLSIIVLDALGSFCEWIGGRLPEGILCVLPVMAGVLPVIATVLPVAAVVLPV